MRQLLYAALVGSSILTSSPAQSQIFGGNGEAAWSRMYHYLESRFGAVASDEVILIPAVAMTVEWNDPTKVIRLMEMDHWGDQEPSLAWQYAPNTSKRISAGYGYFLNAALNSMLLSNGGMSDDTKAAVRRSSEALDFARADYKKAQDDADAAYATYVASTPPAKRISKEKYLKNNYWTDEIEAKRKRMADANDDFKRTSSLIVDPSKALLMSAFDAYQNEDEQIYLPPVREALNQPELWKKRYATFIDGNIDHFMRDRQPQTETIDEQQSSSSSFDQTWKASVSVKFLGLFRVGGASAEDTLQEQHVENNTTRIDIEFTNVEPFSIARSDWFSQNTIDNFYKKLTKDEFTNVFGSNGQLELIPKTLLVARGMKFTVYADSDSLDYLYHHFQGGADAGIKVGWFTIGGGGEYSVTKSDTKTTKFSDHITFEDLSGRAKVIGVLAKRYGADAPALFATPKLVKLPALTTEALPPSRQGTSKLTQRFVGQLSKRRQREVIRDATPSVP
jgi:hypothetical protein